MMSLQYLENCHNVFDCAGKVESIFRSCKDILWKLGTKGLINIVLKGQNIIR